MQKRLLINAFIVSAISLFSHSTTHSQAQLLRPLIYVGAGHAPNFLGSEFGKWLASQFTDNKVVTREGKQLIKTICNEGMRVEYLGSRAEITVEVGAGHLPHEAISVMDLSAHLRPSSPLGSDQSRSSSPEIGTDPVSKAMVQWFQLSTNIMDLDTSEGIWYEAGRKMLAAYDTLEYGVDAFRAFHKALEGSASRYYQHEDPLFATAAKTNSSLGRSQWRERLSRVYDRITSAPREMTTVTPALAEGVARDLYGIVKSATASLGNGEEVETKRLSLLIDGILFAYLGYASMRHVGFNAHGLVGAAFRSSLAPETYDTWFVEGNIRRSLGRTFCSVAASSFAQWYFMPLAKDALHGVGLYYGITEPDQSYTDEERAMRQAAEDGYHNAWAMGNKWALADWFFKTAVSAVIACRISQALIRHKVASSTVVLGLLIAYLGYLYQDHLYALSAFYEDWRRQNPDDAPKSQEGKTSIATEEKVKGVSAQEVEHWLTAYMPEFLQYFATNATQKNTPPPTISDEGDNTQSSTHPSLNDWMWVFYKIGFPANSKKASSTSP